MLSQSFEIRSKLLKLEDVPLDIFVIQAVSKWGNAKVSMWRIVLLVQIDLSITEQEDIEGFTVGTNTQLNYPSALKK